MTGRYEARGVSSSKDEVHAVVDGLEGGLFPNAFCRITPDHLTGDPDRCNIIHSDGCGTKSIIAYLHYRETGDASVFRGIAQDSIVMNLDDMLCAGATGPFLLSNTVNRNARNFSGEALAELIEGTEDFLEKLRGSGIEIYSGGGETADVGDLTGVVLVDTCITAVMNRKNVITGEEIRPDLAIVGIASAGKANYESSTNSGISSNGLTSARHDMLCKYYAENYPETRDAGTDPKLVYCGPYRLEDELPDGGGMTVGKALLSPTRTYAPVLIDLLNNHRSEILGLVHCTGGGQTKCLRFGRGVRFIKDVLFEPPPVFNAIKDASGTETREMYRVFNMGHRMEVYCELEFARTVINAAESYGLEAGIIGRTGESFDGRNSVVIQAVGEIIEYKETSL